jgi:hypothetical protein
MHHAGKAGTKQEGPCNYLFLHADWDHQSKTRFTKHSSKPFSSQDFQRELISVPAYFRNLSLRRVYSHIVFSWKIFWHPSLRHADLVYVCVPPSLSALGVALRLGLGFRLGSGLRLGLGSGSGSRLGSGSGSGSGFRGKKWVLDLVDLWPEALPASPFKKFLLQVTVGWVWIFARNIFYARATRFVSHCRYFLDLLKLSPRKTHFIPLAQAQEELSHLQEGQRHSIAQELRILVLGSINHVLDAEGLVRLMRALSSPLAQASTPRLIVLEILGAGESKGRLLAALGDQASDVQILDHGSNFDPLFKRQVLARCHFGYNGYKAQTAIGITYKSIDFASQGLVFLNSVQGDLRACIDEHGAGFNFHSGEEALLATKLLRLSQENFDRMSQGSRRLYEKLFTLQGFHERMNALMKDLL